MFTALTRLCHVRQYNWINLVVKINKLLSIKPQQTNSYVFVERIFLALGVIPDS